MVSDLVKIGTGKTQDLSILQAEDLSKFQIKIDDVSSSISYYGWAEPGILSSTAKWRILRKSTNGTIKSYQWAEGSTSFSFIWDSRASLSYS